MFKCQTYVVAFLYPILHLHGFKGLSIFHEKTGWNNWQTTWVKDWRKQNVGAQKRKGGRFKSRRGQRNEKRDNDSKEGWGFLGGRWLHGCSKTMVQHAYSRAARMRCMRWRRYLQFSQKGNPVLHILLDSGHVADWLVVWFVSLGMHFYPAPFGYLGHSKESTLTNSRII